jgi:hypothetical protein
VSISISRTAISASVHLRRGHVDGMSAIVPIATELQREANGLANLALLSAIGVVNFISWWSAGFGGRLKVCFSPECVAKLIWLFGLK